jgi:hypothetical protein
MKLNAPDDPTTLALKKLFGQTQPSQAMTKACAQYTRLKMGSYQPTPEEVAAALGVVGRAPESPRGSNQ